MSTPSSVSTDRIASAATPGESKVPYPPHRDMSMLSFTPTNAFLTSVPTNPISSSIPTNPIPSCISIDPIPSAAFSSKIPRELWLDIIERLDKRSIKNFSRIASKLQELCSKVGQTMVALYGPDNAAQWLDEIKRVPSMAEGTTILDCYIPEVTNPVGSALGWVENLDKQVIETLRDVKPPVQFTDLELLRVHLDAGLVRNYAYAAANSVHPMWSPLTNCGDRTLLAPVGSLSDLTHYQVTAGIDSHYRMVRVALTFINPRRRPDGPGFTYRDKSLYVQTTHLVGEMHTELYFDSPQTTAEGELGTEAQVTRDPLSAPADFPAPHQCRTVSLKRFLHAFSRASDADESKSRCMGYLPLDRDTVWTDASEEDEQRLKERLDAYERRFEDV